MHNYHPVSHCLNCNYSRVGVDDSFDIRYSCDETDNEPRDGYICDIWTEIANEQGRAVNDV